MLARIQSLSTPQKIVAAITTGSASYWTGRKIHRSSQCNNEITLPKDGSAPKNIKLSNYRVTQLGDDSVSFKQLGLCKPSYNAEPNSINVELFSHDRSEGLSPAIREKLKKLPPEWRNSISLEKRDLSLRSKESTNNIIAHVTIKILFNGECLSEIKSEFTKNHAYFERECFQQIHEKIEPKILEVLDQLLGLSENVNLPYFEKNMDTFRLKTRGISSM